eukprot:7381047-Prymnesium_polylepis.1
MLSVPVVALVFADAALVSASASATPFLPPLRSSLASMCGASNPARFSLMSRSRVDRPPK